MPIISPDPILCPNLFRLISPGSILGPISQANKLWPYTWSYLSMPISPNPLLG